MKVFFFVGLPLAPVKLTEHGAEFLQDVKVYVPSFIDVRDTWETSFLKVLPI